MHFRSSRRPSSLLGASIAALSCLAYSPSQAAAIRVLFLGGGTTSHDPAAMRDVMKPVFEMAGMTVEYHANESVLHADSLARFDVMFVYNAKKGGKTDGSPDLTEAQEDALYKWIEAGFQGQLVQAVKWGYSASRPGTAANRAHRNKKVTLSADVHGYGAAGWDANGRARPNPRSQPPWR